MGLIKCIDCGAMVSDRAKACPHCGGPIDETVIRMSRMQQQAARPQQAQRPVQQPMQPSQPIQPQQPAQPRVKVSCIVQRSGEPQHTQPRQVEPQHAIAGAEGLTKKCVKCQRDIDINLKFCTYCGAKQLAANAALSAATSKTAQQKLSAVSGEKPVPPSYKRPISSPTSINNDDNQQPGEKSSHNNNFIYGGIAAVLLAGIITFFLTRSDNEEANEPSTELVEDSILPVADKAKAASATEEKPDEKASQAKQSKSDSHRHKHSSHKDKKKDKDEEYNYPKTTTTPATARPAQQQQQRPAQQQQQKPAAPPKSGPNAGGNKVNKDR